ncbi:S8 family peptidase [Geoalkalibacter halelectricus]|uniref:S8 family peptidase n=1 Tax=Geoalkalibacter halelectricus TaxID=2847045 RepID=A0ABY5ZPJ4_9BACT|nr:S8 family peptidase [Geoalkalibacter halelectricus]MDO3377487.1 S8 family peptidase [Geoalkalibacter halelectricus]UWZ80754.1 S8 family peptidase [Geoalkalibacter halelectricus]
MKAFSLPAFLLTLIALFLAGPTSAAPTKEYLVGFHAQATAADKGRALGKERRVKNAMRRLPIVTAELEDHEVAALRRDPRVAYVEENRWIQAIDPILSAEYSTSWGVAHIGSHLVHELGYFGRDVRIAVIDTGVDYLHPDLMLRYAGGYNFVFDNADPMDDNTYSHGTHAAGIIAAELNGIGVVGVAPRARIYGVKVLDGAGFGSVEWLVQGIDWAIDNQMDIINLSLGVDFDSEALRDACDRAYAAGILLIAAAGNTGGRPALYPAAYDSVIAVNATNASDEFVAFSAVDPQVELAAPGLSISSTIRGNQVDVLDGTSQAAPHVTGVAALILAAGIADANNDGRLNDEVRQRLQQSAVPLGGTGERDSFFGYGRVDAVAALQLEISPPPVAPDVKQKKPKPDKRANLVRDPQAHPGKGTPARPR